MDESRLQGILSRFNPWWQGEPVQRSLYSGEHKRRDLYRLVDRVEERDVITLVGPRQVGKSTMIGQLIDYLITEKNVPRRQVLFLTTEAGTVSSDYNHIIRDTLEVYEERILGKAFSEVESDIYVAFDEIQKAENWADTIKLYSDRYDSLTFILTGSVSTLISRETNETLVGRAKEQVMVPMKFIDYVRYQNILDESEVREKSRELRRSLKEGLKEGHKPKVVLALTQAAARLETKRPELQDALNSYLLRGGYPGYFDMDDTEALRELDEDLYRIVKGDLPSVYDIEKEDKLMRVLQYFADSTGSKLSINNISAETGLGRETVDRYIDYLEEFFLVYRCQHYSEKTAESRKQPMAYLNDVGHLNSLTGASARIFENLDALGPILETAVCDHLRRLQFNLSEFRNSEVSYSEITGEVDFVLQGRGSTLPVEVKHGDPNDADLDAIKKFVEQKDLPMGLVINNSNVINEDGRIVFLPAWLFFYLC